MASAESERISQIGLVARSPEGHAAKGMAIKGHEDLWVEIQAHTFKNWVNEHLRNVGVEVRDLAHDFCDGTRLCALVEVLQKKKIRTNWIKKPMNQHHYLENVTAALAAINEDGVKLVNIGNVDIVNGNLKLILGLIWSLIVRYQIGRSKFPPKKLMLAWLRAVLPECEVNNFTTDWNSGIYLSALLDYCEPGLLPNWRRLNKYESTENCRRAMEIAKTRLGVPQLLQPEYLASPHLDELSGMTYLSYFMKEGSPGFMSTLKWINNQIPEKNVRNFTTDWNDGSVLCALTTSLGATAKYHYSNDPHVWESNLNAGLAAGSKLGVEPILRAKDMVDQNVEHLGVMAYAASFQWIPPRPPATTLVQVTSSSHTTRIYTQTTIQMEFLDELDSKLITAGVVAPEGEKVDSRISVHSSGGKITFTPMRVGMHEINVYYDGELVKGSPIHIRAMPEITNIVYTGMEPCAVGSIVEVVVNSNSNGSEAGQVEVIAVSPTGRLLDCPVSQKGGVFSATFQPDEAGEWSIQVKHSGNPIHDTPYTCFVFDPNGIKLIGIDTPAIPESIHNFTLDASGTGGLGQITVDIVRDKQSMPHTIQRISDSIYIVSLHTHKPGKYRIYVYFNGSQVRGSPFPLRVGTKEQIRAERHYSVRNMTSDTNESLRSLHSSFARVGSPIKRDFASPNRSQSPSPLNSPVYRASPLSVPTAGQVNGYSSSSLSQSYHHVTRTMSPISIPVQHEANSLLKIHSPLHSPGMRKSPSPLHSSIHQQNSSILHTSNYLNSLESSSNVRAGKRRDSWETNDIHFPEGSKVFGKALQLLPLNRTSTLVLDTDVPLNQITVTVTPPSKSPVPVKMSRSNGQHINIYFTAVEIGEHLIDIKIKDQRVSGSPFRSHAYNTQAIKVGQMPNGIVGQPVEFEIDGSTAGSGNLEILVNGGHVTSFVRNLGNQRFLASFVPHENLSHHVEMKFNGESVPGSPWTVLVMSGGPGPKMAALGEAVRLVPVDTLTSFKISAVGYGAEDVIANVISPTKKILQSSVIGEGNGLFRLEFVPTEVGSHVVEVSVGGEKLPGGPLVAKVYNSSLIRVTDVASGVVGQLCQFRVDASQAGEGQLEISINEGEVPNHVTVVGGGRCLVNFTPEQNKPHLIDIKFNGETVPGCPFVCSVADTSKVSVNLSSLELIPINQPAKFHMNVDSSGSAELAVSVTGPHHELPVQVTGNVMSGFTGEFTPRTVGPHQISVLYNGQPVQSTPFTAKAYDASKVYVGTIPHGHVGNPVQFTVDASQAGEGNLEITISARGVNIPTQVQPQGSARFMVSFIPLEPTQHIISIHFNQESVPGSPFMAIVAGDFPVVSGNSLSTAQLGVDSHFTMSNVSTSLDDIEVTVEGPSGQSVPAQVKDTGNQTARVEFCPKVVGEHKIAVFYRQVQVAGSPFACKVYDVNAIKVKPIAEGIVGQAVTFLVETSQAGPGNLEVTVNGGRVGTTAHTQGPHIYAISFTPRQAIVHTVDLKFNGNNVPGSPFSCNISDVGKVFPPSEDKISVGKIASFKVDCGNLGPPQVQIMSAMRNPLPVNIIEQGKQYIASFTPKHVGDHSIEVKLNNSHIEGSPFLLKAYDATKVKVTDINPGPVGRPVYFSINASEAGAGNLEIIVAVNGCNVPNYVQSEGNAKFRVNFKPKEAAPHSLSVRFNGEPIPGSPFTCDVFDRGEVLVNGLGVKMCCAGAPTSLQVATIEQCDVRVTSSTGHRLPVKIDKDTEKGITTAMYTPIEVGRHVVAVEIDGHPVKGSPFYCNVYNVNNIKVTGLGSAKLGKAVTFSVDATEAGEGTLELVISTQNTTVKAEVNAMSRGLYDVTFVPHLLQPHFVNITFNDQDVPGSPLRCDVIDGSSSKTTATARGEGLNSVVLGTVGYFEVNPHTSELTTIDAIVTGPNNKQILCNVEKLPSGLYRCHYQPSEIGTHLVFITQKSHPITKQPFSVQVFNPAAVQILDISEAEIDQLATFKIDTEGAGSGALSVSVRAAGNDVKHTLRELNGSNLYEVAYTPKLNITHKIHVKYNGVYASGCPIEVPIQDKSGVRAVGLGLYQSSVGKRTSFVIETYGDPSEMFDVIITGPGSSAVPVRCYQQKDGNLLAEFVPSIVGLYKIEVMQNCREIRGSPYYCQVFDATKVKIDNISNNTIPVNDNISFKLNRKEAGFAELDVTVRSPLGQDLPLVIKSLNQETDLIELTPPLPGKYSFNITYGGQKINDYPVTFNVIEGGVARAWGPGLSKVLAGSIAHFNVSCVGVCPQDRPVINIVGPGSNHVNASIVPKKQDQYDVSYTPPKVGMYDISVTCGGKHISGSPYRVYVVSIDNIRTIGDNLQNRILMTVNVPYKILFDLSEAGLGEITGDCSGPQGSTVPVNIQQDTPESAQITVTPRSPGPHTISLFYAGFPMKFSPISALAEAGNGGVRLILTGKGLASAICNQIAEFNIDGSQAGPGVPEVSLKGMKNEIKVNLLHLDDNIYKASYLPTAAGAYLLNVMWSGRQVKGCPLKVTVTAMCDSSKVVCSGEGLGLGTVGKHIRSFIDTRMAGPGELSAHCVGPHKVAYCELYDHGDGTFTLNVKPQEAGRHTLTVKYGGVDVPGSPFILRICGASDASKVRVVGPGIQHGVLATFQSRFICDTRGAGAGQLSVRVRGPKGAFRVEMQRGSQKDRMIMCKYDPTEPGDYRVEVKWAGELVPGSPFSVMIFDTQEELNRFLQGNQSPTSELYGSVAYSTGYAHITP
ncbi:filamin-A isoform X2 [Cimex lectularius]|uniref:Calponin-homology (CH) domain-containing protein n=1 Tax=Cimex lectularius TaxID=79782 RepID=A0A8I6RBT9_CIMLE|nr:filamin-A isoform X2 [Cimex lectularius]